MTTYRLSYKQTEYRHVMVEADSEDAARAMFDDGTVYGDGWGDEFDLAEDSELVAVDER